MAFLSQVWADSRLTAISLAFLNLRPIDIFLISEILIYSGRGDRAPTEIFSIWHREIIVGRSWSGFSTNNIIIVFSGGSSRVFKKAFWASIVNF